MRVSYIGMQTQEVVIKPTVNVVLKADAQNLDEVVVTGYGITRKAAFTGSATTIGEQTITSKTDANFMKTLQGNVAGLQMNNSTGMPGAQASVSIRGIGSYKAGTEPLYIIDGTPMFSDPDAMSSTNKQYYSPLSSINANDIESVTVLKDASATAIYGARAANGVIVITTKQGSDSKMKINFNAKKGVTQISPIMHDYKIVNASEWIDIWGTGYLNAGTEDIKTKKEADAYALKKAQSFGYSGTSTDWLDAVLRTGKVDEYSLDVSGKTGDTNYFVSGGYYNNEGIIINTGVERYSGRINLSSKYKRISFGINSAASYAISNGVPTSSSYVNPLVAVYGAVTPVEPIYNEDGSYNLSAYYNPVAVNDKENGDLREQKVLTANVNPYISIDLGKGLIWKTSLGINYYDLREYQFWSPYNNQGAQYNGLGQQYNDTKTNIIITNTLNWIQTIGDHHLNIMLGQEAQKTTDFYQYYAASKYSFLGYRDMGTAAEYLGAENMHKYKRLASYFFNGQYDYENKYYLSGSLRYDGSSSFGAENLWGLFWSVGGKWRVSEEAFWEPLKENIQNVTVRASYGTVGNQDIDWYAARGTYETGYNYNNEPGMKPTRISNPDLGWESRHKFNIGVDFTIFNRINLTVDWYDERTKDLIFEMPLSKTNGLSTTLRNIGEMKNTGIELSANANILRTKNFNWEINANLTANKNEMVKLSGTDDIVKTTTIITPGESLYTFYLKEYAGVDPDNGSPLWYKKDGSTTSNWNDAEQRIVGSADPKVYGGFGTSLKYKGFDFNANFSYSCGNKIYASGLKYDLQVGDSKLSNVTYKVYENAWTETNRNTDTPKFVYADSSGASKNSTRFLLNGSYLRLKSVTVGYSIPKSLTTKYSINNIRFYASADNLFTIHASDFIGFDPEAGVSGTQAWQYPVSRTFTFGLNVSF